MWKFIYPKFLLICLYFTINISMGIVNRDGALYMATGVDTTGLILRSPGGYRDN